ncbi:hypothetical protein AB3G45_12465 [Shinella sp. S4-D37]|uniref:hypothetical protein n=1 Tax=Shinella sp. S4-D37 TaxID=3161999 RepID=UPI0034650B43
MKYFQAQQPLLDVSATTRYGWVMKKTHLTSSEKTTDTETLGGMLETIGFMPLGRCILIKLGVQKSSLYARRRDKRTS